MTGWNYNDEHGLGAVEPVPNDWVQDIHEMHAYYGVHDAVDTFDADKLKALLQFRIAFLREELTELETATTPEDVVDALIDLCVVAIGTLDLYDVDAYTAWNKVHKANMSKKVGVKASRPNPLGLPDLIKPEGWVGPDHTDNYGLLIKFMD